MYSSIRNRYQVQAPLHARYLIYVCLDVGCEHFIERIIFELNDINNKNFAFFLFFFPILFIIFRLFSLSLLVITQLRGHIAGSSPPSPLRTVRALHSYRAKISALSSLVDSRPIVPTHATVYRRSQQSILLFQQINSKSHHGGIRTPGPTIL